MAKKSKKENHNKVYTEIENELILDAFVNEEMCRQDIGNLIGRETDPVKQQLDKLIRQKLSILLNQKSYSEKDLNERDEIIESLQSYIYDLNNRIGQLAYLVDRQMLREGKTKFALHKFKDNINIYCKEKGYLADFFHKEFTNWIDLTVQAENTVVFDDVIKFYNSEIKRMKKDKSLSDEEKQFKEIYPTLVEQLTTINNRIVNYEEEILNTEAVSEDDKKFQELIKRNQQKEK